MPLRLFHFSEHGDIALFTPRPVQFPSQRAPGRAWLNDPLVWAIAEWHQPMYLFPRDCPRILVWPTPDTTPVDRLAHWGDLACRMIAYVESGSVDALRAATIVRYELPDASFEPLDDAGMWVSRSPVEPISVQEIRDFPAALAAAGVEVRVIDSLAPLRGLWKSSLHVSGIRLRNAPGW